MDTEGFHEGVIRTSTVCLKEGRGTRNLDSKDVCTNRTKIEDGRQSLQANIEAWRKGRVNRLRAENKDVYYWGNRNDETFAKLILDKCK